jgi:hypothetical protein
MGWEKINFVPYKSHSAPAFFPFKGKMDNICKAGRD